MQNFDHGSGPVASNDAMVRLVADAERLQRKLSRVMAALDRVFADALHHAVADAEADGSDVSLAIRSVAAELAAALRMSDRTIQRRMDAAATSVDGFPEVWAAQCAGRITGMHTRVIVDAGVHIDDAEARAEYATGVVSVAERESPNRLRTLAERAAEAAHPRTLMERGERARATHAIWVSDEHDGVSQLGVRGPTPLIHAAFRRVTSMAKLLDRASGTTRVSATTRASGTTHASGSTRALGATHASGATRASETIAAEHACVLSDDADQHAPDPRTRDQQRADLVLDLLLTGAPAGHDTADGLLAAVHAHVNVTVPVLTLLDHPDHGHLPAELNGRVPIDPHTARRLAGAASAWDRVLTDPITGGVLAVDRYRPSEQLRRFLQSRDQRCRFPGCGMQARDSDLDHTHDAAYGGATEAENLASLCRRHHMLKHHSRWTVRQVKNGTLEWRSPTGRTYTDQPPPVPTVVFSPTVSGAPPPF